MLGLIMSIIAGAAMSIQGVWNTRLSEKIGLFESNVMVQGTAFLLGLLVMFFFGKGSDTCAEENSETSMVKSYSFGNEIGTLPLKWC